MGMTRRAVEWRTVGLAALCYLVWLAAIGPVADFSLSAGILLAALAGAQHASLQHEAIHGHPFRAATANALLVGPALTLAVPYARFRDLHLSHHRDANLTDPYDDPESNYLDPARWAQLTPAVRLLLRANNALAGRMLLGPAIGQVRFVADEWRRARHGERAVLRGWAWHLPAVGAVALAHAWVGSMTLWAALSSAYLALAVVKVRTFAEHRAHERRGGRTAVIESRGPLALLFLNNNLHAVHHMHPGVPWYRLPALYRSDPERYLRRNGGYRFASYRELFRLHLWQAKDPVPHPFYRGRVVPDGEMRR